MLKGLLFILPFFLFISCSDEAIAPGKQDDTIKLSTKSIQFGAGADSAFVITEGDSWKINNIEIDNLYLPKDSMIIDTIPEHWTAGMEVLLDTQYVIKGVETDWINIEKRNDSQLFFYVQPNLTNKERTALVGVSDRNYFDRIKVTQKSN